jgi:hypothetical protein
MGYTAPSQPRRNPQYNGSRDVAGGCQKKTNDGQPPWPIIPAGEPAMTSSEPA